MQNLTFTRCAVIILLSFVITKSLYGDNTLAKTDPEAKCDFIGYLAYEITLYRDAGIDHGSTLSSLEQKYVDNKKVSQLVPFYVKRLYSDATLSVNNVQRIVKDRCLLELKAVYSQQRY